jgi:hypothetical protein
MRVNAIAPGCFLGEQNRALLVHPGGSLTPRGEQVSPTPWRAASGAGRADRHPDLVSR